MRVFALDPGTHSGIAFHDDITNQLDIGQFDPDHHFKLWQIMQRYSPDTMVVEMYQKRPDQKAANIGALNEYIGVVKLYCETYEVQLVLQTPAAAKNLWTDSKIRTIGLWQPQYKHAMDALRHLFYYETVTLKSGYWVEQLRAESPSEASE